MGIAIFTSSRYVSAVKERRKVLRKLEEVKNQISQLENDKEALNQKLENEIQQEERITKEKQTVEETLRISQEKFAAVDHELSQAQKIIDELNNSVSALKKENVDLMERQEGLKVKASQLNDEKAMLESRLNSIPELKKAIRELKTKVRKTVTRIVKRTGRDVAEKQDESAEGNLGYVIKDGKPNFPTRTKVIEVTPAP